MESAFDRMSVSSEIDYLAIAYSDSEARKNKNLLEHTLQNRCFIDRYIVSTHLPWLRNTSRVG